MHSRERDYDETAIRDRRSQSVINRRGHPNHRARSLTKKAGPAIVAGETMLSISEVKTDEVIGELILKDRICEW